MDNTVVYIIGFPGTGKLTVAKELCKKTNAKLVDNHVISNVIFSICEDINHPKHLQYRTQVRNIALDAIAELTPPKENVVLTNVLYKNAIDWYTPVEKMANKRKAKFVPIVLSCAKDENIKRIKSDGRSAQYKTIDENVVDMANNTGLFEFSHSNRLDIDNTNLSASETADLIIKHVNQINMKLIKKNINNLRNQQDNLR